MLNSATGVTLPTPVALPPAIITRFTIVGNIGSRWKALAKLVMLHNIMETTEGPPNQPMLEVFDKTAGEIDAAIAEFDAALAKEMAKYDEMAR